MRQEMTGFWDGSGISWTICKQSAPHSRQITTPTCHHSGRMLFLTTNHQCQSTDSTTVEINIMIVFTLIISANDRFIQNCTRNACMNTQTTNIDATHAAIDRKWTIKNTRFSARFILCSITMKTLYTNVEKIRRTEQQALKKQVIQTLLTVRHCKPLPQLTVAFFNARKLPLFPFLLKEQDRLSVT